MRLAQLKDPAAWMKLASQERLAAGAKAAANKIVADLKTKQLQVSLQIAAHDRIANAIEQAFANLRPEKEHWWQFGRTQPGTKMKVVSGLLAFDPTGHGIQSAETATHAIANESVGSLFDLWNSVKGVAG
ncbi:MAG: hypothetical protein ACREQD_17475, partial [Candidatus Binataceae bacterium]